MFRTSFDLARFYLAANADWNSQSVSSKAPTWVERNAPALWCNLTYSSKTRTFASQIFQSNEREYPLVKDEAGAVFPDDKRYITLIEYNIIIFFSRQRTKKSRASALAANGNLGCPKSYFGVALQQNHTYNPQLSGRDSHFGSSSASNNKSSFGAEGPLWKYFWKISNRTRKPNNNPNKQLPSDDHSLNIK